MDCAGCGACCDPVWLPMTPAEIAHAIELIDAGRRAGTAESETNLRFVSEHMTPLEPQPETYVDGVTDPGGMTAFRCGMYDPIAGLCTAHDSRPPICSGYPWYGQPAGQVRSQLHRGCSHLWDLPVDDDDRVAVPVTARLLPLWPIGDNARSPG